MRSRRQSRQRDHQHEGDHHHRGDQEEHARVDAAQEQDAHGDHRDHHEGAHVRLGQQQHADHRDGHRHRQHGAEEALLHVHLAHHVVGGIEQHRELGQLRRLEADEAQRDPAARAVDALADVRDQHRDQQHQRQRRTARAPTFSQVATGTWKASSAADEGDRQRRARGASGSRCARSARTWGCPASRSRPNTPSPGPRPAAPP